MFAAEFAQLGLRSALPGGRGGNTLAIGYAGMMFTGGSQADVVTLAVHPDRWGKGTGTALLTALVDEAIKRGYQEVLLEVREDNPRARAALPASTGSPRSGSGAATTSRPASTPWSCGRRSGDGIPAGTWHRDVPATRRVSGWSAA